MNHSGSTVFVDPGEAFQMWISDSKTIYFLLNTQSPIIMTLGIVDVNPLMGKNKVYIFKVNDKIVKIIDESWTAKFKRWIGN